MVAGSLWTAWPLTSSTTTEEAPHVQASACLAGCAARFAGAAAAATVRTSARQAKTRRRPRFIWFQRHMASKSYGGALFPSSKDGPRNRDLPQLGG